MIALLLALSLGQSDFVFGEPTPEWLLRPPPQGLPQAGRWTAPEVWTASVTEVVSVPDKVVERTVCYGNGCRVERVQTYRKESRTVTKSWRVSAAASSKPPAAPPAPPAPKPARQASPSRGSLAHQGNHYDWPGFPSLDALAVHMSGPPHNISVVGMSNEAMLATHDSWHRTNDQPTTPSRRRRWRR